MKVLYLSHNLQNTGWGRAARENILALDAADVDIVWRPIRLNGDNYTPTGRYAELYEKDIDNCTHCIQHVLPPYLSYNGKFEKSIAYFVAETLNWNYSGFHHHINLMDELWCPNAEMANNAEDFIKCPINVVPHPTNISQYEQETKPLDIPELDSGYNFYCIADWNRRKRIPMVIQAFNLAFSRTEPVNLVIKVHKAAVDPRQLSCEIQNLCNEIKTASKLYSDMSRYPSEIIITSYLSDDEMASLHKSCHCFVNASYGEAWNYPAFDAMAYGNAVISTNCGGPKDFLRYYSSAYTIDGLYKPVFGMHQENFPNYNSSFETWCDVDVQHVASAMKDAYNNKVGVDKNIQGLGIAKQFSYEKIGSVMKELLNDS